MLIDQAFATQMTLLQTKIDALAPTITNGATPSGNKLYFQLDEIIKLASTLQGYTDKDNYDYVTGVAD